MIVICNDAINRAIKYLEENHSVKEKVYLHIAEGFDCIESPDGQKGFGCYIPSEKSIYLAEEIPDKETSPTAIYNQAIDAACEMVQVAAMLLKYEMSQAEAGHQAMDNSGMETGKVG